MDWKMKKYPMYYGGVKQIYPNVAPGKPIFSRTVKVGNLIFLAGMAGRTLASTWDSMDISDKLEEQAVVSLDKLRGASEESGSSMNNFVKTHLSIRNLEDLPRFWKASLEYYQKYAPLLLEEPPVSNVIQPISMAHAVYKEEIGAIAVESTDKPGWEMKKYPMYYGGVKQTYPNIAPGIPMLSRSAVVGNLIFVSDMDGRTLETGEVLSDNIEGQTVVALDKLRFALEEAGSSMDNVIKTVMYLNSLEDLPRLQKVVLEYYQKHAPLLVEEPPISTISQPVALAKSDSLVKIEALGVQSRNKPGWEMKKYPMYYGSVKQPHTKSIVVGNLIFCSRVDPQTPESGKIPPNFEEQMFICLDKIRFALEEAGGSMNNMFYLLMFPKDMEFYTRLRKTELEYYQKHAPLLVEEPPISGPIQLPSLTKPEYLIELGEVMGVIAN
jgi:2-iminobutanoate/2-iminopropanoate deaminase